MYNSKTLKYLLWKPRYRSIDLWHDTSFNGSRSRLLK
jgi:hypothetical protein